MNAMEFVQEAAGGDGLYRFLMEQRVVWVGERYGHRRWDEVFKVVQVADRMIGFLVAETPGYDSPEDKGWEFCEETICYVEPYKHTETRYRQVTE